MGSVRYMVNDVDEAVRFYTQRLGFSLAEQWGAAFAILQHGDLTLWVSGPQTSAARAMPDGRVPQPGGWNRIVIKVDDIDVLTRKLSEAGTTFRNQVISGPGGSQVLIEDPSGNPIELFQPATKPVGAA
ncbi:MAG: VOC family protein [Anaerolineaceae bacterium]|jgi:catechol 2,3-dioxygenase-like lactoylglutathione lyase family enzyme